MEVAYFSRFPPQQDTEKVGFFTNLTTAAQMHLFPRAVLASLRGFPIPNKIRIASSLAAALLGGLFEHAA